MDIRTIRVSEPRELLAYLPHQLGFRPRDSAVAVSLRPPRGRVGLVARVDLADLADPVTGPQLARGVVAHLDGDLAEHAVLVLYTDTDPRTGDRWDSRAHRAARHFRDAAQATLGQVVVWVVAATGYLALDCDDPACCPPGGRPLRDLESTAVGAQMVLAGSAVADCREDVARIATAPAQARRAVTRVAGRWRRRREAAGTDQDVDRWRARTLAAWRAEVAARAGGEVGPVPARLGRIEAGLDDRVLRDAVLLTLIPGTGDLAERSMAARPPTQEVADALATVVDARAGQVPPAGPTALHVAALEAVVAHGRRHAQAPACTLLALLAWWQGDGARAQLLVERALGDDPGYRLAALLGEALSVATPPGWARQAG